MLQSPDEHTKKQTDDARRKTVRITMDCLIGVCTGRPTEVEILHLAKSLASTYPVLPDRRQELIRDNFVNEQ